MIRANNEPAKRVKISQDKTYRVKILAFAGTKTDRQNSLQFSRHVQWSTVILANLYI